MKKNRFILIFCIFIGLGLVVSLFFIGMKKNKASDIQITTVKEEIIENNIEISGNVEAANQQTLYAAGDGTVKKVFVAVGDRVKKGQLLVQMDSTEQDYHLAKHDYDMEQKRISGALKEVELMKIQRYMYEQKVKDRQVYALYDGIIADLSVDDGDYLEAKDVIGTLVDRSYLKATVEIVENDVPKLEVGQKVFLDFPAYDKGTIEAVIESFPAVGVITSRGASVVEAVIRIDNPPEAIFPHFSFTGKIEITAPEKVLVLDKLAIIRKNGTTVVEKRMEDGSFKEIEVKVVPYGLNFVKIISGLSAFDEVKLQERPKSGSNKEKNQQGMMQPAGNKLGMPMGTPPSVRGGR